MKNREELKMDVLEDVAGGVNITDAFLIKDKNEVQPAKLENASGNYQAGNLFYKDEKNKYLTTGSPNEFMEA